MLSAAGSAQVSFDLNEVHALSVQILTHLDESSTTVGLGSVALAMSLGRLLSISPLSDDAEIAFIQALMQWSGAYFAEGLAS